MAFVDRLEGALEVRGVECLIDRSDIYYFEEFWSRIQTLITESDTVVFVISPDAVSSEWTQREVAYAESLNKRLAPIVCKSVEVGLIPRPLRGLNFISFENESRFEKDADELGQGLLTNIVWIRKHTELGEQALRWVSAKRPSGLLLRSPALEDAESWIASRPRGAPLPTEHIQSFVAISRREMTRRRTYLSGSLAAGLVLALGLAAAAFWQRSVANEERRIAVDGDHILTRSNISAENRNTASVWSVNNGTPAVLEGHRHGIAGGAWSPDGRRVITVSSDKTGRIWDSRGPLLAKFESDEPLAHVEWSADGERIIATSQVGTTQVRHIDGTLIVSSGLFSGNCTSPNGAIAKFW